MTLRNSRLPSALLSLGSNIEPELNLPAAASLLADRFHRVGVSRVFETQPVEVIDGGPFLNSAVEILCPLTPLELKFEVLRPLEKMLGRVRTGDRNAPRTIDLDISLFADLVISDPEGGLVIPDPDILTCAHVAIPLADLAPDRRHPQTLQTLEEIARRLETSSLRVVQGLTGWPEPGRREP